MAEGKQRQRIILAAVSWKLAEELIIQKRIVMIANKEEGISQDAAKEI